MKAVVVAVVLVVLGLGTLFASYLVWMNRASEKILTAVIPIAVAALAGVFIAVFVFGGEPAVNVAFPASFQYRIENKSPVNLPLVLMGRRFHQSLFAPAMLYKVHPEFFNDPADPSGATLYHHLLQRAIIDWMGMYYRAAWQAEILQFDLPVGREGRFGPAQETFEKPKILSTEEIARHLEGSKLSDIHAAIPLQIALPHHMVLIISGTQPRAGALENGEILLETAFCSLSITTESSSWFRGIGTYRQLAGMTEDENNRLGTSNYMVRIKVRFNRLRSGHPRMALYKAWATQLADELEKQFDEQVIWSKTKEDFIFWKGIEHFGPAK